MDSSVRVDRELTWRKTPKPIATVYGLPVVVDDRVPGNTVRLVHPDTGATLAEIKIK